MKRKDVFAVMVIGSQTPSKVYEDYWEAENEAIRLVKHTKRNAFVLKVITSVELSEVVINRLEIQKDERFNDSTNELRNKETVLDYYRKQNSK